MNNIIDFKAGVTACLRSWSALRTAVESGWGGGEQESKAKADDLRNNIFHYMDGSAFHPRNFDVGDLADSLAIYMEEEFSVTLEDGSDVQVAEAIFAMYEGCFRGDPTLAREMVARAGQALEFSTQFPAQIQTTEHDDDDDEDMTSPLPNSPASQPFVSVAPALPHANLHDYSEPPLFGTTKKTSASHGPIRQLGQPEIHKNEIMMDDDGFAPVGRKGKGK